MARSLSALLLVVALLVCPYTCRAGACSCCARATATCDATSRCPHGCCPQHDRPIADDSQSPAAPNHSCPNDCICKGALANADPHALNLEIQDCAITHVEPVVPASLSGSVKSMRPLRADRGGTGSALRIACCSWLC